MKIVEAGLFEYHLPLFAPLPAKQYRLKTRDGLLVRLRNALGAAGWGDIAPLPGFSREDISQASDAAKALLAHAPSADSSELAESARRAPASVAFGIETALMNLKAFLPWPGVTRAEIVPVNGLLSGSLVEVESKTRRLIADGYHTLKLKVGRESVEEDLEKVAAVRRIAPHPAKLRLDANQAWEFGDAIEFGKSAAQYEIEHIEEPLKDNVRLEEFYRRTSVSYALDESLCGMEPDVIGPREGMTALVLKPTLLGGIGKSLQFARRALASGLTPVISSSFESSVGLLALANIASAVAPDIPCGLGTDSWFVEDLLRFPITIKQGSAHLAQSNLHAGEIRMDLVKEVVLRP